MLGSVEIRVATPSRSECSGQEQLIPGGRRHPLEDVATGGGQSTSQMIDHSSCVNWSTERVMAMTTGRPGQLVCRSVLQRINAIAGIREELDPFTGARPVIFGHGSQQRFKADLAFRCTA